jgi:type IV pilus assembly protein PilN
VILINLLPHREAKRQERKRAFFAGLLFAVLVGVGLAVAWYSVLEGLIHFQTDRNKFLQDEIHRLDNQIKDVASLKAEIDALKARQKAVEDLEADRNMPVYLLNELVKQTPEGVYLTSVKQTGQSVAITGQAQTNERISEFLRNAAYNSPWLERPQLGGIRAITVGTPGTKDAHRMFDFSVQVTLKRPPAPGAAASGASAVPAPKPIATAGSAPTKS